MPACRRRSATSGGTWGTNTSSARYTLTLHVNEAARVYIDDKLVVEELKGTNKRKGAVATVSLTEGLHPLKVEFWDSGGLAKIQLLWQIPGAKVEEVIPAKVFV